MYISNFFHFSLLIHFKTMIKALLIVICLASSSASSSCLLGDGDRGVELICPEYSGTGATLCCGHSVNRSAESWGGVTWNSSILATNKQALLHSRWIWKGEASKSDELQTVLWYCGYKESVQVWENKAKNIQDEGKQRNYLRRMLPYLLYFISRMPSRNQTQDISPVLEASPMLRTRRRPGSTFTTRWCCSHCPSSSSWRFSPVLLSSEGCTLTKLRIQKSFNLSKIDTNKCTIR